MKAKSSLLIILISSFIILNLSLVNAEFYACFNEGDFFKFCNPLANYNRCHSYNGCTAETYLEFCMDYYNETGNCYGQSNPYHCNVIVPKECTVTGGSTIDREAPTMTMASPIQSTIYTTKQVWLNMSSSEVSDIYYYDNIVDRGQWTRVCNDCYQYSYKRSFTEGFNDLTFRATDAAGNEGYLNKTFYIDSIAPKVGASTPKKNEFTSGDFEVQITEANPQSLVLHYGNLTHIGMQTANVNLASCYMVSTKKYCPISINVGDYEGYAIQYWFNLTDIVGRTAANKPVSVKVDTTAPVIANPGSIYTYTTGTKYVYFNISIIEPNFDIVEYYDTFGSSPKWKTLCSSLKNGNCVKTLSLAKGNHTMSIQITDDAGNSIGVPLGNIEVIY